MPNGKPGDHPLTDLFVHKMDVFPRDIQDLILKIHALDPDAFSGEDGVRCQGRPAFDTERSGDWFVWEDGENLEKAQEYLERKLEFAKQVKTITDPAAEALATRFRTEFPKFTSNERIEKRSFPLDYPDPNKAGKRIVFPVFVMGTENPMAYSCLSLYTYPDPEFYWLHHLIQRYPSGEIDYVMDFMHDLVEERLVIKEFRSGFFLVGEMCLDSESYRQIPIGEIEVKDVTWRRSL